MVFHLISPYGNQDIQSKLLKGKEQQEALKMAQELPKIPIGSREFGDLIMIGNGSFNPLKGFMNYLDWHGVCKNMQMNDGLFWPIPITLSVSQEQAKSLSKGMKVALTYDQNDDEDKIVAILYVEEIYLPDKSFECRQVFRTEDPAHPGVKAVLEQGEHNVGGSILLLSEGRFPREFPNIYLTPLEVRKIFLEKKWKTIVAFQTRNPMHASHTYLVENALKKFDAVFIHSLLGDLKKGDIPPIVSVHAIQELIKKRLPSNRILQAGYPLSMRYAGPREALLHAIFRQNYGCTHLIIGRNHAGVGEYYSAFAAQEIFDHIPKNALQIQPLKMDTAFWCYSCKKMSFADKCPHPPEDHLDISGTELRRMLENNIKIPAEFSPPEVLEVLKDYYNQKQF